MNAKCIAYFIFACVLTSLVPRMACALDERPRKDESKIIRAMCEAPWDNAEFFKKRFPEAFAEAAKCKKYKCSGVETPSIDYVTDRNAFAFNRVLEWSIIIAAKPGGLEEQFYRLEYEAIEAIKTGDTKTAEDVLNRQKKFAKDNGIN